MCRCSLDRVRPVIADARTSGATSRAGMDLRSRAKPRAVCSTRSSSVVVHRGPSSGGGNEPDHVAAFQHPVRQRLELGPVDDRAGGEGLADRLQQVPAVEAGGLRGEPGGAEQVRGELFEGWHGGWSALAQHLAHQIGGPV